MFFLSKLSLQEAITAAVNRALVNSDEDKSKIIRLQDQIVDLKKERAVQVDELEGVKLNKKHEIRDIEHLVKCKTEKNEIEAERKAVALEKDFQKKEMALQTEYHNKSLALIEKGATNLQDIYGKIIERLPNVSMNIEKQIHE